MATETRPSNVAPEAAMALLVFWLLSLLLLQSAIWLTARAANWDISWLEAAGLSVVWLFTRTWFMALTATFNKKQ